MNPYQELGVEKDADEGAIKRAFRRRARETHPDKGGVQSEVAKMNTIVEVQKTNIATLHRLAEIAADYAYLVDEPPPAQFITVHLAGSTFQFRDAP